MPMMHFQPLNMKCYTYLLSVSVHTDSCLHLVSQAIALSFGQSSDLKLWNGLRAVNMKLKKICEYQLDINTKENTMLF